MSIPMPLSNLALVYKETIFVSSTLDLLRTIRVLEEARVNATLIRSQEHPAVVLVHASPIKVTSMGHHVLIPILVLSTQAILTTSHVQGQVPARKM